MTRPLPVLPGKTYLISRRCTQRQFLLTPSAIINQILIYLIAVAANRKGVLVHAVCVMGNHLHLVVTDSHGEISEFCRWLFEFVAKCVNAYLGRWESVFAPGSYSRVELLDDNAVLNKIVYTLCNPVQAGLVNKGKNWPGVRLGPWQQRKHKTALRPNFFRPDGPLPPKATISLFKPPAFSHLTEQEYLQMVNQAVSEREEQVRLNRISEGKSFLGVAAVQSQSPQATPWTKEERWFLNPRIASHDKWRRIQALQQDREWLERYRDALTAYRQGNSTVLFPVGTYWMVRYSGANSVAYSPN